MLKRPATLPTCPTGVVLPLGTSTTSASQGRPEASSTRPSTFTVLPWARSRPGGFLRTASCSSAGGAAAADLVVAAGAGWSAASTSLVVPDDATVSALAGGALPALGASVAWYLPAGRRTVQRDATVLQVPG